jgi:hypothetical protein
MAERIEPGAREMAQGHPGPQIITRRAEALQEGIVPDPIVPDRNYLMGRIALNKEEMQMALGIGRKALDAATKRGEIPSVLIGGRRLYPIKAVENHLAALAYASSGALDAWEHALVKANSNRLRIARRRAQERRRYLVKALQERRRRGVPATLDDAIELRALVTELDTQQMLTDRAREKILREIEQVEREARQQ